MNTWLNQGRLRRPGRGLKKWEKLVESKSTNRLEHKNPDTPEAWVSGGITFLYDVDLRTAYTRPPTSRKPSAAKLAEERRERLCSEWEHLKDQALFSVRDYFKEGGSGAKIPDIFHVKLDSYSRGLNNRSAKFWLNHG